MVTSPQLNPQKAFGSVSFQCRRQQCQVVEYEGFRAGYSTDLYAPAVIQDSSA
jgi:hypothetical protein